MVGGVLSTVTLTVDVTVPLWVSVAVTIQSIWSLGELVVLERTSVELVPKVRLPFFHT